MMQHIRTLLEDDRISETDKILKAKQLVQDTPFPSMTETPIHFFQTDNSKKRKKVTLCADRGKSSDCCGISIFERQKNLVMNQSCALTVLKVRKNKTCNRIVLHQSQLLTMHLWMKVH
jgi:hypothetical protein